MKFFVHILRSLLLSVRQEMDLPPVVQDIETQAEQIYQHRKDGISHLYLAPQCFHRLTR